MQRKAAQDALAHRNRPLYYSPPAQGIFAHVFKKRTAISDFSNGRLPAFSIRYSRQHGIQTAHGMSVSEIPHPIRCPARGFPAAPPKGSRSGRPHSSPPARNNRLPCHRPGRAGKRPESSPLPPLAMPGLPDELKKQRPSEEQTIVCAPFTTTQQPRREAKSRVFSIFSSSEAQSPANRRNSPK